jgi:hypothetical protein
MNGCMTSLKARRTRLADLGNGCLRSYAVSAVFLCCFGCKKYHRCAFDDRLQDVIEGQIYPPLSAGFSYVCGVQL